MLVTGMKLTVPTPTVVASGSKYVSYATLEPEPAYWLTLNDLRLNSPEVVPAATLDKEAWNVLLYLARTFSVNPTPAWEDVCAKSKTLSWSKGLYPSIMSGIEVDDKE